MRKVYSPLIFARIPLVLNCLSHRVGVDFAYRKESSIPTDRRVSSRLTPRAFALSMDGAMLLSKNDDSS